MIINRLKIDTLPSLIQRNNIHLFIIAKRRLLAPQAMYSDPAPNARAVLCSKNL